MPWAVRTLKYAQLSYNPRRSSSSGPLTWVWPAEPSTYAEMTRGEYPRRNTSMPRKVPFTSPRRRAAAVAKLMLTVQLCCGPWS